METIIIKPSDDRTHPHVEINVGGVDDSGDGVDHVETHLHGVPGVVSTSLWQS